MTSISNGIISVAVDDEARLVSFENLRNGHGNIIEQPAPIFRCCFQNEGNMEVTAKAVNADIRVWAESDRLFIEAASLGVKNGNLDVDILMTLTLDCDKLLFDAKIDNRSSATLADFYYPCVGAIKTLAGGTDGLLFPWLYGHFYSDINAHLASMGNWDGGNVMSDTYPYGLSMQWMSLIDGDTCLYMASRDDKFYPTVLRAVSYDCKPHCTLEFDKMPYVVPGNVWEAPQTVARLYEGSWLEGSRDYAEWAKTWRHPVEPREWVKDMNGFFLVIMKQQFGDEIWSYDEIPELYKMALDNGCDALGLFGWFDTGHDNGYPDLVESESMGGRKVLTESIEKVHEAGGHVVLYQQGHLIDPSSDFYSDVGHRIECKTIWGTSYYEEYSKYSQSDFLFRYSNKFFASACPWCKEWHDLMGEKADWVRSFGADAILYDQIGGVPPKPCFDKSHGHDEPTLSYTQGRLRMFPAIREHIDGVKDYAFMSECVTDIYSQFLDCVHGVGSSGTPANVRLNYHRNGGNMLWNAPEMFMCTFPDHISTLRNPSVSLAPWLVNYALTYGFRFELEVRYQNDRDVYEENRHPDWREYSRSIFALRKKYASTLLRGNYSLDPALMKANPGLCMGIFTNGDEKSMVLWNNNSEQFEYDLLGEKPTHCAVGGEEKTEIPDKIAPGGILTLFFD